MVIPFAPEAGEKWTVFPLFAADSVKSDRLPDPNGVPILEGMEVR